MTTPAVADGLLYVADSIGKVYCFDAEKGDLHWSHDCGSRIYFGSPLLADDKLYVPTQRRKLLVFRHGERKELLSESKPAAKMVSPTATHGLLVLPTARGVYVHKGPGYRQAVAK